MSSKSARIAEMIQQCQGQRHDAHYLGFFELFNRGLFYESHDVLEEMWLPVRLKEDGAFYKGLIQLAGAFVHLQKERLRPAGALFKLAWANLQKYPAVHHDLEVPPVIQMIEIWHKRLEAGDYQINPLKVERPPELRLRTG
jgi:predicted metal-dependent hydrolase